MKPTPRFDGAQNYVATDDLKLAVNAALTLQRPLLIKGEPGTGKTMLAEEVAAALNMPLLQWHSRASGNDHLQASAVVASEQSAQWLDSFAEC